MLPRWVSTNLYACDFDEQLTGLMAETERCLIAVAIRRRFRCGLRVHFEIVAIISLDKILSGFT